MFSTNNIVYNSYRAGKKNPGLFKAMSLPARFYEVLRRFKLIGNPRTYLVGGFPRDHFMMIERDEPDFDIATSASLQQIQSIFTDCEISVRENLVSLTFQDKFHVDVFLSDTLANKQLTNNQALVADALNRDFTINTLYLDRYGHASDPLGRAFDDMNKNSLVTVSRAFESFQDDPIRILRAIYLTHVLDFTLDNTLNEAIQENLANFKLYCFEHGGKTNAWLAKLFIKGNAPVIFKCLNKTNVLTTLFPELTEVLTNNPLLNDWLQKEIAKISDHRKDPLYSKDKLSLNYVYGLFITCIFESRTQMRNTFNTIDSKTDLLKQITSESPLFQKNFEGWITQDYYYLLANEEWKKFHAEVLSERTSPRFFSRAQDTIHTLHRIQSVPKMRLS